MDGHALLDRSRIAGSKPIRNAAPQRPWSWRLGEVAGIGIHLHLSLLVILGWLFVAQLAMGRSTNHAIASLALLATVFAIIVVHELAHALVARRFGCTTRDITLWAIGGVARLDHMPEKPRQELAVALAGPAVNLAIAGVLALMIAAAGGSLDPAALGRPEGSFATKLLWVNISLAAFNLVPAFPMDGGRVLRAILAMRRDRVSATATAARVAQRLAWVLGALGVFYSPMLLVIAVFVWLGAAAEASTVQVESALSGHAVSDVMLPSPLVVRADRSLGEVARLALTTAQPLFPIVDDDGRLAGAIDRVELVRALAASGAAARVGTVMRRDLTLADSGEPLIDVLRRMTAGDAIVIDGADRPTGLVTADAIGQFAAIDGALRAAERRQP
jgi:Zn-dependent protease